MLDFLNSNPGFVAILGVVVGWLLSSFSERKLYKKQRKDELEKEHRERFKHKAEFIVNNAFVVNGDNFAELSFVLCSYKVKVGGHGELVTILPKNISRKKLEQKTLYLENIGGSDVNEFAVAASSPKSTAIINKDLISYFAKNGFICYDASVDEKIRKGNAVKINIYYLKDDPIINWYSSSLDVYYRDSLNNVCMQPLFPELNKIYEPMAVDYQEWREHVSVRKNLEHWEDRLKYNQQY